MTKHPGNGIDFMPERDAELRACYRRLLRDTDYIDRSDILFRLVNTPSSRFWVSEERAAVMVSRMERRLPLGHIVPSRQRMYEEIFRRYLRLRRRHPDASIAELVRQVVYQPAPSFYLTPKSAEWIMKRPH